MPSTTSGDLALEFVTLNDYLRTGGDRETALDRLVHLALATVPGCCWAAVTAWPENKRPFSLATTDAMAVELDELQYEVGEGPCLTAAADSEVINVDVDSRGDRWPKFFAAAEEQTPMRGLMSYHLADIPHRTALNLYTDTAGAFDDDAVATAALFAAHARVLLIHAASADKAVNLEHALSTSRQIGAAIGILMNTHKVTTDAAFGMLRTTSQRLHRKLHEIAYDVTQTGTLPDDTAP